VVVFVAAAPSLRSQVERCLVKAGFDEVHCAESTAEAIHWLQIDDLFGSQAADIVLLDEQLPGAPCLDLCRRIKATDRFLDTPIIIMGAGMNPDGLAAFFEVGAEDYAPVAKLDADLPFRVRTSLLRAERTQLRRAGLRKRAEELALARRLQRSVLAPPITSPSLAVEAAFIPSDGLSGDMYYWCQIDEDRYGILLIDVMGHGLAASLVSMALRSLMHGLITRVTDPAEVMRELNGHMILFQPNYLTALYVVIDTRRQTMEWANAGHPPGLLHEGPGPVGMLERTSVPLGLTADLKVEKRTRSYSQPARLLLYTDGLAEDPGQSVKVGIEHLKSCLQLYQKQDNGAFIAVTLLERRKILAAPDDICLIAVTLPVTEPFDFSSL